MARRRSSDQSRLSRSWFILGALYAAFFFWYTSFAGPLSEEEIAHFSEVVEVASGRDGDHQRWITFMETDTGDDFAMWVVVDLEDTPKETAGVGPGESSEDVVDRYAEPFFQEALIRASHPVAGGVAASGALDIWGIEGADGWESGLLVRYRSRRDIMEMMEEMVVSDEDIHAFKVAAVEKTIAFPVDPWVHAGDPRLLLALVFLALGLFFQLRHNARAHEFEA